MEKSSPGGNFLRDLGLFFRQEKGGHAAGAHVGLGDKLFRGHMGIGIFFVAAYLAFGLYFEHENTVVAAFIQAAGGVCPVDYAVEGHEVDIVKAGAFAMEIPCAQVIV